MDFDSYYESIWGSRWSQLKEALLTPEIQVVRWNRWAFAEGYPAEGFLSGCVRRDHEYVGPQRASERESERELELELELELERESERESLSASDSSNNLLDSYVMDPASVMVARALPIKNGDSVLDLCAAPGGKTLILAESLPTEGELVANELSFERRERLQKVIQNYIPRAVRERIWVKGQDGSIWGVKHPERHNAVLLDAPCSGERHLLNHAESLKQWTPKRGQGLAHRQYALLCSAWMSTQPGGYFLYSTCSLNPQENEGVIRKFSKKKEGFEILKPETEIAGESLEFGQVFLPDRLGFGPLYFCLMRKLPR